MPFNMIVAAVFAAYNSTIILYLLWTRPMTGVFCLVGAILWYGGFYLLRRHLRRRDEQRGARLAQIRRLHGRAH